MAKRQEVSAVLERHITRLDVRYVDGIRIEEKWVPNNTDSERAHLNRELVSRKIVDEDTGKDRTMTIMQAVRKRIKDAGIKTIRVNQNTALEIILSGSPETMNSLSPEQLEKWTEESLNWAKKTWGEQNIVAAALHMDEKTPHIHLIVVPIVQGQSRRSRARDKARLRDGKKVKTRKRKETENRLCANEVFARPRLYSYHTDYAKKVGALYGLERGIMAEPGSRKRHTDSAEYNRELERQRMEYERLIAALTADYTDLQTKTEKAKEEKKEIDKELSDLETRRNTIQKQIEDEEKRLAAMKDQEEQYDGKLKRLREDLKHVQIALQSVASERAIEEGKRNNAKKETEEEIARLQVAKMQTEEEIKKALAEKEHGEEVKARLHSEMGEIIEKGRDIESRITEREEYLRSLGSKSLLDLIANIPEIIKKELNSIVGRYYKGQVDSFAEKEIPVNKGDVAVKEKFIEMKMKWPEGKDYTLAVRKSDARVWVNGKFQRDKNGDPIILKPISDYFTQALSQEGVDFVGSLYRRTEFAARKDDPIVDRLREKFGDIGINSVVPLKTNGKMTGRMYRFTVAGKKRTAVWDDDAKGICICVGHAKPGAFHFETWTTLRGNPAVSAGNRVYSLKYKMENRKLSH